MATKNIELENMSLDDLWRLHEEISGLLSTRIRAEKDELEKRLAALARGMPAGGQTAKGSDVPALALGKPRRQYPRVLPKYRNPQTSETWSGRGKRPRWLVAAIKSGHKIEEFRISDSASKGRQKG
jgi:DNA-binding protein H-NS